MESTIFGVSVRALLALITVVSGLGFLILVGLFDTDKAMRNTIVTSIVPLITLALGYYLGQKTSSTADE